MTVYLLDVNVLIALLAPGHSASPLANRWFERIRDSGWATCPLTENGVIRVMSLPSFPSESNNPVDHAQKLGKFCGQGRHHFWPDDVSSRSFLVGDIKLTASQITDLYLLVLAVQHEGKFATFDQKIPTKLIAGGDDALEVISS